MDALRDTGLLPLPTWRQVILATSKRSFRINLPPELASELERGIHERGLQVQFFVDKLRMVSQGLRTSTRHLVVIDGLDDILTNRKAQFDALAALVLETNRLNLAFQRSQVKAKVIVLCRTDLFEKLPGANKNKIRQDSAVHLDWYQDPRQPEDSSLVKLVSLRAQLADPSIVNLFETYFPSQVEGRDIVTFLLELTRHTPRDFIQILRHVQQFAGPHILTRDQVLSGTRSYSINYFLPEIRDELVGYVSDEDVEATVALIGSLRKRDFYLDELQSKSRDQERYARVNLPEVISALFECSALGNLRSSGATTYYTFKFRNRNSTLNLEDRLILHRGMWKAMNLA